MLALPEVNAESFYKWHEDFIINGNNEQGAEKGGTLSWLESNGSSLGTLKFSGLGIFKCAPEKFEASSDNIRRVKAEMYCEEMQFSFKSSWA